MVRFLGMRGFRGLGLGTRVFGDKGLGIKGCGDEIES